MIGPFEYVTVLISIILGLGITQILTGIADLVQRSGRVIVYWPHLLWILFVMLLQIQEWWILYELKDYHPWRLPTFLFTILYPINLFILSRLLFPRSLKGKEICLKEFYFANYPKIFATFALSAILSILFNLIVLDLAVTTQFLQLLLALFCTAIAAFKITNERIHQGFAIAVFLALMTSIFIERDVWIVN